MATNPSSYPLVSSNVAGTSSICFDDFPMSETSMASNRGAATFDDTGSEIHEYSLRLSHKKIPVKQYSITIVIRPYKAALNIIVCHCSMII